jgi:hypothetical protein
MNPRIAFVGWWLAWLCAGPAPAIAQGTFVYQQWINPNPRTNVPWDDSGVWVRPGFLGAGTPLNVDMDLDGNVDFQIVSKDDRDLAIIATGNGEIFSLRSPPPDLGGFAARLLAGQSISSLTPVPYEWMETINVFGQPIGATLLHSSTAGQLGFWGGQFGYLGVRIQKNGEWHYGWIRGGVPLSIVPEGIFYEAALNLTPSDPIFAGQVPEPSVFALFIIAGIGLLTLRWRSHP